MLLALDLGNTELTVGGFVGSRLEVHWRLTNVSQRTPDEWAAVLLGQLRLVPDAPRIRTAIMASVVPQTTRVLTEGIEKATGATIVHVGPGSDLPITLDVEEPLTVGADRVVNVLAASALYPAGALVVDFGTATTFDCITSGRRFIGGVIMPGLRTMGDDLARRAAKLPATELEAPAQTIGRRTEDCIRSGVLFGAAEAVDGMVRRILAEWPEAEPPTIVATGGLAPYVIPHCREVQEIHPTLTLEGLRLAAEHFGAEW